MICHRTDPSVTSVTPSSLAWGFLYISPGTLRESFRVREYRCDVSIYIYILYILYYIYYTYIKNIGQTSVNSVKGGK